MITPNGRYTVDNTGTVTIVAPNSGEWSDYTSWEDWNSWLAEPEPTLRWLTPTVDLGRSTGFCINTDLVCSGTVTYYVYTSNTGAFAGEEIETVVEEGDTNITAFSGRFVIVGLEIDRVESEGIPTIFSFSWTSSSRSQTVYLNGVNSTDLSGKTQSRVLNIGRPTAGVLNIQLTPYITDPYVVDGYWADSYAILGGLPSAGIRNKSASPEICFTLEGEFIDAIFDAQVLAFPEQFMSGRNISIR